MDFIFLIFAFAAEVIGTIAGFGSSTIALPFSIFLFDFHTALILVAFLHLFGNLGRLGFFRSGLDKTILLRFGAPSILFTICGAFLVTYIPQEILKGILGIFLIAYTFMSWSGSLSLKPTVSMAFIGGGLSGFFAGLIGTGGALRGAFLDIFGLSKERYIPTAAAIALAVDGTRLPIYLREGFLETRFYWMLPILFIIALLGSYVGRQIVSSMPQQSFRRVVLAAIFVVGVKFIYDWVIWI